MALDEAPPFWWRNPGWLALLAAPVGFVYGRIAAARMERQPTYAAKVPVICVGNFVVGGGGKTPTVQLLLKYLLSKGMRPGVLSRGHGGAISTPTLVNLERHNAHDVGDEPLLHAELAKTVIATDRPKGATVLEEEGCDIIVMDDGFQNPSLHKDYNLVVVDTKRGLGNRFAVPAGPLRAPLKRQMIHADSVFLIGDYERGNRVVRHAARAAKPIYNASVKVKNKKRFKDMQVLAFAGIADPSKFFDTVERVGAVIKDKQGFGDHHVFLEDECKDILERAREGQLELVTTTKDHVRLKNMGDAQNKVADLAIPVEIDLVPDNPSMLDIILRTTTKRFDERKLRAKKSG
ncbi:MAG: tetraacyldisaccharide 4'-kinase [Rhizobiaceae bacterium]|nr:tetraacyldisaccharide 4'-kinase [Rhizobiaceae bacterium]